MKITVFQALTILAQKYKSDQEKYNQIKQLYLTGVRKESDSELMAELLEDRALEGYEISKNPQDINEDPVRRYFESQLSHETLKDSLDRLDMRRLNRHFASMYNKLSYDQKLNVSHKVFSGTRKGGRKLSGIAKEYAEAVRVVREKDSFESLKPENGIGKKSANDIFKERKAKMEVLAKCGYAAKQFLRNNATPLNYIYNRKGYVFDEENRGRQDRFDPDNPGEGQITEGKNALRHKHLGIMRPHMPLSRDDALFANKTGEYYKPTDMRTFKEGAQMSEEAFATQVTPFVNSISGTMLTQLRVMAALMKDKKLLYEAKGKNKEEIESQLKEYFRSFVTYMIYNSGGHSLNEFMRVLALDEVQKEFKDLPGFSDLTIEYLFKDANESAFERAVEKAVEYNSALLQKRKLHEELIEPKLNQELQEGEDELTVRARSHLKSMKDRVGEKTSLDRKNKAIDKAYLEYTAPRGESESEEEYTDRVKNAEDTLVNKLNIKLDGKRRSAIASVKINEKMSERQEQYRQSLFTRGQGTMAERLDKAWECYKDQDRTLDDRLIAQSYMIFVLDIKEDDILEDLNSTLNTMMLQRELVKDENPEYIPGKSPIALKEASKGKLKKTDKPGLSDDEDITKALNDQMLLDVNMPSRKKDSGEETGQKTNFFDAQNRDMFRVVIRNGQFVTNEGKPFDTSKSISKRKEGFAAFTLNVNGELSIFQYRFQEVTGIAHSSMNASVPVFSAGEVKIKNGKLLTLTDRSGHYAPSLYNMYKTLDYFRKQGIDISDAKVYTSAKRKQVAHISKKLNIDIHKSENHPQFYELKATDLCNTYAAHMHKVVTNIQSDLDAYQKPSFMRFLYKIKDFIMGTTLTSDREQVAKNLAEDLVKLADKVNTADTVVSLKEINNELKELINKAESSNKQLNVTHGKNESQGNLANRISTYRQQLNKLDGRVDIAVQTKQEGSSSDADILSSSEHLKGLGRGR